jgi:toxin ParE1/3/4
MAHRLAPQVEFELDDIWYYIARDSGSIEIADRLIDSITDRFFLLGNHPYVGRLRDDLRPGLRSFPVGQYLIIYRIDGIDVLILHVAHGSRDVEAMFGR